MSKYVGFRLGKVHESHVISEYYCGGCGWPVTDHDSFCPECGGAFRECDASNLEAENAKLRELVQDMMRFFEDGDYCTACEKVAECDAQEEYDHSCLMRGVFYARMRELGMDVDNGTE